MYVLTAAVAGLLASAAALSVPHIASPLKITTTHGPVIGTASPYREGVTVYRGIPFAAPPVGGLRWKAPVSPAKWTKTLNATTFSLQCAQSSGPPQGVPQQGGGGGGGGSGKQGGGGHQGGAGIFNNGQSNSSEDCLYLNVWTPTYTHPSDLNKKRSTFVWIFGSRFTGGSGDVKTYDGSGQAALGHVVVTLNYRLGPFGFLAHPDLSQEGGHDASGNYGILDQQAALRWVHDNIAHFGGDPDQVVVGGQSAGSASALDTMWSPLTKGLVHGVIAESGARGPHDPMTGSLATSYRTKAVAETQGVSFFKDLNVTSLEAARALSMDALLVYDGLADTTFVGTQFANLSGSFMEPPLWRPVIDGYVLTHTYGDALAQNAHADIPIMTGNNADESGASVNPTVTLSDYKTSFSEMFQNYSSEFFSLYPADNDTQAGINTDTFFRDMSRVSTWTWATAWAKGGAKSPVFSYYFQHTPPENPSSGSYHGSELWYTTNNIPYAAYDNSTWSDADCNVEKNMAGYWSNFIRSGNPNGAGLTHFPASVSTARQTMYLGDKYGKTPLAINDQRIDFIVKWFASLKQY
ncbi:hypothetical protein HKX48_009256 [Thoreauomyces humboldtii]|nr:hypothetical protein HKX48_009256 [Thoreauomyces humboldtii]